MRRAWMLLRHDTLYRCDVALCVAFVGFVGAGALAFMGDPGDSLAVCVLAQWVALKSADVRSNWWRERCRELLELKLPDRVGGA